MSLKISKYTKSDWQDFKRFILSSAKFHESIANYKYILDRSEKLFVPYAKSMTAKHRAGSGILLIAKWDGNSAGYAYGEIAKSKYIERKQVISNGTIKELFVDENYRKKGIATTLITEFRSIFKKSGCKLIRLKDVYAENEGAYHLYKKLGFKDRLIEMSDYI